MYRRTNPTKQKHKTKQKKEKEKKRKEKQSASHAGVMETQKRQLNGDVPCCKEVVVVVVVVVHDHKICASWFLQVLHEQIIQ